MLAYVQGVSLGLAYVAPIGVQNLFVINAGLAQSRAEAYRTALIVIFFDVTLALAGFFGIGALIEHSDLIRKGVLLVAVSWSCTWGCGSCCRARSPIPPST